MGFLLFLCKDQEADDVLLRTFFTNLGDFEKDFPKHTVSREQLTHMFQEKNREHFYYDNLKHGFYPYNIFVAQRLK